MFTLSKKFWRVSITQQQNLHIYTVDIKALNLILSVLFSSTKCVCVSLCVSVCVCVCVCVCVLNTAWRFRQSYVAAVINTWYLTPSQSRGSTQCSTVSVFHCVCVPPPCLYSTIMCYCVCVSPLTGGLHVLLVWGLWQARLGGAGWDRVKVS